MILVANPMTMPINTSPTMARRGQWFPPRIETGEVCMDGGKNEQGNQYRKPSLHTERDGLFSNDGDDDEQRTDLRKTKVNAIPALK